RLSSHFGRVREASAIWRSEASLRKYQSNEGNSRANPPASATTAASHLIWSFDMSGDRSGVLLGGPRGAHHPGHRRAGHGELDRLGKADLEIVVLDGVDRAVKTAVRKDLVAFLEVGEHVLVLFLLLLLGADEEDVEDDEDGGDGHQVDERIRRLWRHNPP